MTLRLAFMGTPDFAVPTLAELVAQGHDIAAVYSQPSRPKGRGLETDPSPVHKFALGAGIEVRTPVTLKDAEQQDLFRALDIDAAIVVAYGLLLPKPILDAPKLGCFNLHGSLLPRWRGAAPIQRAIMAGDSETGVMVMRMEEGLDTGPVLMAERTAIGRKTYGDLHDELARLGADLMVRALSALERGSITEQPQPGEGATYAKKIEKSEAQIWWTEPATVLDRTIRGLSPIPGAWTEARPYRAGAKTERLKILLAEPVEGSGVGGDVLRADGELIVACGEGALRILKVQRSGGTPQNAETFLRGFPLKRGSTLWLA
jgi:methionyl-tRNA formyltransferase